MKLNREIEIGDNLFLLLVLLIFAAIIICSMLIEDDADGDESAMPTTEARQ